MTNTHSKLSGLTSTQKLILQQSGLTLQQLDEAKLFSLIRGDQAVETLSTDVLLELLQICNALYRGGEELVSDEVYDFHFLAALKNRQPDHPFLQLIEAEHAFSSKTETLPERMLSTDKAYNLEELERWARRIKKAADSLQLDFAHLVFKVTPKLDGFAAFFSGEKLFTRGDGRKGTDISRVLERGLTIEGNDPTQPGAGEIVVSRRYFEQNLANRFDNPRNFQASVIREKSLDDTVSNALVDGAVVFYPFHSLPCWSGAWSALQADFPDITANIRNCIDYDVDGVVIEVTNTALKQHIGATRHHHRWQIAYKNNQEMAQVEVLAVIPQTSRSGRINPVVEVPPTRLSGAIIQRVSAHHYGMVVDKGIGVGALLQITRSGEVIPKIENIIRTAAVDVPQQCPSCSEALLWDNDYLICTNHLQCPAQITHTIEHFFKTLANNDGFGKATVEKLYAQGIREIDAIYALKTADFIRMDFGPKQSANLENQLLRSRREQIEDWRFLAAFGIYRLGTGNCEKLLQHYPLSELFALSEEQIIAVAGFAEKTASAVVAGLKKIAPLFAKLNQPEFNLLVSEPVTTDPSHPLAGKQLVFSGTMQHGSRSEMQAHAKLLGAKIGSAVTSNTDYLVTGDKVGSRKLDTARKKGVKIIAEQEYLLLTDL